MALCDVIRNTDEAEQTRHYIEQLQKQDQDRSSYHLALCLIDSRETNMIAAERNQLKPNHGPQVEHGLRRFRPIICIPQQPQRGGASL